MVEEFYVAELDTSRCEAELYLNDIPVKRCGRQDGHYFAGPVHSFLVDGSNEIAVVIEPGGQPTTAIRGDVLPRRFESGPRRVTVELARYPHGAVVGAPGREVLAKLEFEHKRDDPDRPYPQAHGARVDLGTLFGPWKWQQAEPLVLDASLVDAAEAFLRPLHEALSTGLFTDWIEALSIPLNDSELAYGQQPGEQALETLKLIAAGQKEQGWASLQPFTRAQLRPRLCAQRRMIECLASDGAPILRTTPDQDGVVSFFPAMIGRLDGRWRVLR